MKYSYEFLSIFLVIILTASCKKEKNIDYRDQYIGDYSCHKTCSFWMIGMDSAEITFNGPVNVVVTKVPSSDNLIVVDDNTIPIDSTGHYFGQLVVPGYKFYTLDFRNDSIFLSTYSGGLGSGTSCYTAGKK